MVEFKTDSELGVQLKHEIAKRLANVDDPEYVAEFLLVLISNNRSPAEIVNEFTGLFGSVIDEAFVQNVINEIQNFQNTGSFSFQQQQQSQQSQQSQQQLQAQPQEQPLQQQAPSFTSQQEIPSQPAASAFAQSAFAAPSFTPTQSNDNMMIDGSENKEVRFSDNTPQSAFGSEAFNFSSNSNSDRSNDRLSFTKNRGTMSFKGSSNRGGRNVTGARAQNNRKQNLAKMMEMSLDNNMDGTTTVVSNKPAERCKDFPHCPNRICPFAHPTRLCRNFPNCPNTNQTCTYLHPGEDDELVKEYEKVREAKIAQRSQGRNNVNTGITLCKFGAICSKELCPFGHPTPANKDAKVTILQWCVDNKACKDPNCSRAHSSPNFQTAPPSYQAVANPSSSASNGAPQERTLEQCKFGSYCKNHSCPKRHAKSPIMCRQGAECTRIDCFFTHPINEVCKFGVNCTNVNCPYQHPDGKQINGNNSTPTGNKVWINGQTQITGNTAQRQFAVGEDQILEHAPQQA